MSVNSEYDPAFYFYHLGANNKENNNSEYWRPHLTRGTWLWCLWAAQTSPCTVHMKNRKLIVVMCQIAHWQNLYSKAPGIMKTLTPSALLWQEERNLDSGLLLLLDNWQIKYLQGPYCLDFSSSCYSQPIWTQSSCGLFTHQELNLRQVMQLLCSDWQMRMYRKIMISKLVQINMSVSVLVFKVWYSSPPPVLLYFSWQLSLKC